MIGDKILIIFYQLVISFYILMYTKEAEGINKNLLYMCLYGMLLCCLIGIIEIIEL